MSRSFASPRALAALLLLPGAGCGAVRGTPPAAAEIPCDPERGATARRGDFLRTTIDASAAGAAYVTVADLDGNGRGDLVVSRFGAFVSDGAVVHLSPARLDVYYQGAAPGCWHRVALVEPDAQLYFLNQTTAGDLDGDGDLDLILAGGFFVCGLDPAVQSCGLLAWLENDKGHFIRHDLVGPRDARFYHHAEWIDFDGDGVRDLVTVAETSSGAVTQWLRGQAAGRFEAAPRPVGDGLGSFPQVVDVDGDGDLDVAAAEYFVPGESFAWLERRAGGEFARHVMAADRGHGFQLALVPDLYGDGVTRAVATNHVNANDDAGAESAVLVFDRPADATARWNGHVISRGIRSRPSVGAAVLGAPGVFGWGDLDGDGDLDLAVAGDGDDRALWLEQIAPGQFATRVVDAPLGQASGARIVDLDGDGRAEVVFTGYEDGVVYVYRLGGTP